MNVRRSAAALAAAALVAAGGAPAALADGGSPSPSSSAALPPGLYGTSDPTYDGVFRQSYALLAQLTGGVRPTSEASGWLTVQQCADGGFAAYRARPAKPCDDKTPRDSNSTAAAVQALAALGGDAADRAAGRAVDWLKSVQNDDGGWGYNPGMPSDANSTGIVVGALAAVHTAPGDVRSAKGGKTPWDALPALALPCAKGGAFGLRDDKSGKLSANADATAAGVLGGLGKGMVATAGGPVAKGACRDGDRATARGAAANGARYLARQLAKSAHLTSQLPGADDQPDYGNTADAVVALAAAGRTTEAKRAYDWLSGHAGDWAESAGPAGYAQLILAAHAAGRDPHSFGGGTDLVTALAKLGPAPATEHPATGAAGTKKDGGDDGDGIFGVWWWVGVCLVIGVGIGFLFSRRGGRGA
ncbi:prenyltransferase/squalene oxidase repeat-containing protein [Streptomyces sp. NPDC050560]|uniref:prenyltransferase/squalene oxidase repeat-containing protein n=1 Tax=Streptomyces sp. NPDC050560 TaxID=3365630 RepID=UPI00378C0A04